MFCIRLLLTGIFAAILALPNVACQSQSTTGSNSRVAANIGDRQYYQAIAGLTTRIENNPNDADAYFRRGFVYSVGGHHNEAIKDYTAAIGIKADFTVAYENRATGYYRLGRYDAALADYTTAITLDPDYAIAYQNRAWAYYALGDYEKARADIGKCRSHGGSPDDTLVEALTKASARSRLRE